MIPALGQEPGLVRLVQPELGFHLGRTRGLCCKHGLHSRNNVSGPQATGGHVGVAQIANFLAEFHESKKTMRNLRPQALVACRLAVW